jgi:hypothetical protein
MPPQFVDKGTVVQHPLERKFNAPAWDILSAIERGFRAQVDVKGKLAELFLFRRLQELQYRGVITALEWRDKDGIPDFLVEYQRRKLEIECKNVRSGREVFKDGFKVEIQKTRSQVGGGPVRGYKCDEFDVLAACLFNQTGQWRYLFAATANLECRAAPFTDYLVIMHKVPATPQGYWRATIEEAFADARGRKR